MRFLDAEPAPDFSRLERTLRRQGEPDRVPFCELFSNIERPVLEFLGLAEDPPPEDAPEPEREQHAWRQHITYMLTLGYDYVNGWTKGFGFPKNELPRGATPEGERAYYLAASHTIANREDFEAYPWPDMSQVDYTPIARMAALMPDGMRIIGGTPGGVLENAMWLFGYEGISYLLYEDAALVRDVFDAVGCRMVEYADRLAALDAVGGVFLGDDLGFKTQTLLSPAALREYMFPWHERIVEAIHRHGKLALLHACGYAEEVMGDIIACGWDAKHSFEDAIQPVWEAKAKYGDHIALIGGFDMDKLTRMTPDQVRRHTRFLLDRCAPGGGWALGTGNSVANYIPTQNFLTMLDEGLTCG